MKKLLLTILLILTLLVSACSLEPASEKQIDEAIEELSDEDLVQALTELGASEKEIKEAINE